MFRKIGYCEKIDSFIKDAEAFIKEKNIKKIEPIEVLFFVVKFK